MQCYICELNRQPSGALMRSESKAAGICHNCGVGVCKQHGNRANATGAPLLCPSCAVIASELEREELVHA